MLSMYNTLTGSEMASLCNKFAVVLVTAATLAVTEALHAGRLVNLSRAAGVAVTLPNATGTGDIYNFFVGATVTSNTTTITRGTAADVMSGLGLQGKAATGLIPLLTAANTNTITLNGSTTGGILGDWVELIDVGLNQWALTMIFASTGTIASPFSNT